jgi:geranylgeranyl transferase type-2 subunit beta
VDVFHTFFGLAALSLLDPEKYNLQEINPTYAISKKAIQRLTHLKVI